MSYNKGKTNFQAVVKSFNIFIGFLHIKKSWILKLRLRLPAQTSLATRKDLCNLFDNQIRHKLLADKNLICQRTCVMLCKPSKNGFMLICKPILPRKKSLEICQCVSKQSFPLLQGSDHIEHLAKGLLGNFWKNESEIGGQTHHSNNWLNHCLLQHRVQASVLLWAINHFNAMKQSHIGTFCRSRSLVNKRKGLWQSGHYQQM